MSWTSGNQKAFSGPVRPPQNSVANTYTGAVNQQAGDYDNIMAAYQSLLNQAQNGPGGSGSGSSSSSGGPFSPITAQQSTYSPTQYSQSAGFGDALSQMNNAAQTGGYSENDISSLRARGVSPIRAVYAQAQQNLARQKSLQGGYSPNYGALQSKMAREQSSLLSDKSTDVNAQIADMVAKGKASALSQYGSMTGNENTLMNTINSQNAAGLNNSNANNAQAVNQANQFNSSMAAQMQNMYNNMQNSNMNNQLNAVQGMQSLYGTTPALVNTFGQQVLNAGNQNIAANQAVNQQQNTRANMGMNVAQSLPPIQHQQQQYNMPPPPVMNNMGIRTAFGIHGNQVPTRRY